MGNKENTIKMLNMLNEQNMLPGFIVNLISADALLCEGDCNDSINIINDILEVIDQTEIEDKDKWKKEFKEGLKIVKRDKKKFQEENE